MNFSNLNKLPKLERIKDVFKRFGKEELQEQKRMENQIFGYVKQNPSSEGFLKMGYAFACKGFLQEAIEYLDKSDEQKAKGTSDKLKRSLAEMKKVEDMMETGKFDTALSILDRLKNDLFDFVGTVIKILQLKVGVLQEQQKKTGKSPESLKNLLRTCSHILFYSPDSYKARDLRSKIYKQMGEYQKLCEDLSYLIKLSENDASKVRKLNTALKRYDTMAKNFQKRRTFYEILGVKKTSTAKEIEKAYKLYSRKQHPDRFRDPFEKKEAEELFAEVGIAKETLVDEEKRRAYDESLEDDNIEMAASARGGGGFVNPNVVGGKNDSYGWGDSGSSNNNNNNGGNGGGSFDWGKSNNNNNSGSFWGANNNSNQSSSWGNFDSSKTSSGGSWGQPTNKKNDNTARQEQQQGGGGGTGSSWWGGGNKQNDSKQGATGGRGTGSSWWGGGNEKKKEETGGTNKGGMGSSWWGAAAQGKDGESGGDTNKKNEENPWAKDSSSSNWGSSTDNQPQQSQPQQGNGWDQGSQEEGSVFEDDQNKNTQNNNQQKEEPKEEPKEEQNDEDSLYCYPDLDAEIEWALLQDSVSTNEQINLQPHSYQKLPKPREINEEYHFGAFELEQLKNLKIQYV